VSQDIALRPSNSRSPRPSATAAPEVLVQEGGSAAFGVQGRVPAQPPLRPEHMAHALVNLDLALKPLRGDCVCRTKSGSTELGTPIPTFTTWYRKGWVQARKVEALEQRLVEWRFPPHNRGGPNGPFRRAGTRPRAQRTGSLSHFFVIFCLTGSDPPDRGVSNRTH
jgi:hypothetical protein